MTSTKPISVRAFTDTNSDFSLGLIGQHHKLILNKYCVVRPQFVLHTVALESQNDALNERDCHAALECLAALGDGYMVIFNCGPDAGASINHRHLQILPKPADVGLLSWLDQGSDDLQSQSITCEIFASGLYADV